MEKAKLEKELHASACNVLKRPGQLYFYYARSSGQKYLSIMSPQDWGASCPHEFLGGQFILANLNPRLMLYGLVKSNS